MSEPTLSKSITLDTPIVRGNTEITEVRVRKPQGGELRGAQIVNLLNMDVASLELVLPRITVPTLTKPEVTAMDPADMTQLGIEVAGFLSPKAVREGYLPA